MAHLISTLNDKTLAQAEQELRVAHDFLVKCAQNHQASAANTATWGIETKRLPVSLDAPGRPESVVNSSEKMVELVNMVATVERLLDAIAWFRSQTEFEQLMVLKCHPSTSSGEGNDLVLGTIQGEQRQPVLLCEVSDVVAKSDGNGKANKDIKSLNDAFAKISPPPRCYLCMSSELASGVLNRNLSKQGCAVTECKSGQNLETVLLEVTWL